MNRLFRPFRSSRFDKHIAYVRPPVERTWGRFFAHLGKFVSIYGIPAESNPLGNCRRCHKRPQAIPGPLCYECFEWVSDNDFSRLDRIMIFVRCTECKRRPSLPYALYCLECGNELARRPAQVS